jgi:hypothetical protein
LPRRVLGPAVLAGLVRLLLIAASPPPEVWEYDVLARNLLAGDGYVYEHLGTPYRAYYSGLPYVSTTAGVFALWESATAMLVVQALFAMALCAVVASLAGPLAGLLTALHPALVYYDVRKLHPLGLDALLGALAVLCLVRGRHAALCGFVLGLGVLQRGSLLPFAVFALVWLVARPAHRDRRPRTAALFIGGLSLAVAPWLARNATFFGRPLLVTTSGEHFFVGNVPPSVGGNLLPSGEPVLDAHPGLREELSGLDEVGQERLFWARGVTFAREHPAALTWRVVKKLGLFWTFGPQTGALYPRAYKYVYLAYYFALLALAIVGSIRLARGSPEERSTMVLILALFASVSLVHACFYVEMRHRWALEPLLLALACYRPFFASRFRLIASSCVEAREM